MIQSLAEPFLPYYSEKKWPDGLASYSLSYQQKQSTTVTGTNNFIVMLFPGMRNYMVAVEVDTGGVLAFHRDRLKAFDNFTDYITGLNFGAIRQVNPIHVSEWRPVCYGLKITTMNTENKISTSTTQPLTQTSGWFYSYRLHPTEVPYAVVSKIDADTEIGTTQFQHTDIFPDIRSKYLFPLQSPSLCVGPVAYLNDCVLQLNPATRRNEFCKCSNSHFYADSYTFNNLKSYQFPNRLVKPSNAILTDVPGAILGVPKHQADIDTDDPDISNRNLANYLYSTQFDVVFLHIVCDDKDVFVLETSVSQELLARSEQAVQQIDGTFLYPEPPPRKLYYNFPITQGWYIHPSVFTSYLEAVTCYRKLPVRQTRKVYFFDQTNMYS